MKKQKQKKIPTSEAALNRALRFTCPSTGRPYLVRVQPDVETAEAAIIMLNKGTHPDNFIWEH